MGKSCIERDLRDRIIGFDKSAAGIFDSNAPHVISYARIEIFPKRGGQIDRMHADILRHRVEGDIIGESLVEHIAYRVKPARGPLFGPGLAPARDLGGDLQHQSFDRYWSEFIRLSKLRSHAQGQPQQRLSPKNLGTIHARDLLKVSEPRTA